ncbi:leucine-rich repeat-containing protein 20 isoform X1 [Bufo bufo]|uniref:leucine-rich repeat-containing protein 20 isoform X1 n=1 Tax=Bufo bufo TaxID=8384 RepID=UPI001ABDDACE|nr:leucine-rich repeat-containing protein 20 isoform X1 [Bufo bufo]XP_040290847.1 leucine-rich repeat-containing protein 20 isoform X1 [Bufo bufo]
MAEAVAKVARRVNDMVNSGGHHLDLSGCSLTSFPVGLYLSTSSVADKIFSISLANNELKSLTGKFFTVFKEVQELDLQGNLLHVLPHEISLLGNLKTINLARNKFETFPDELTKILCIENINLEGNEIKDIPVDTLNQLSRLLSVNLKLNPINKDVSSLSSVKYKLDL